MSLRLNLPAPMSRSPLVDSQGVLTPDSQKFIADLPKAMTGKLDLANFDTRASRLSADVTKLADGTLWVETDTNLLYMVHGNSWQYVAGFLKTTADLLAVDATGSVTKSLGTPDTNLLIEVTDFAHILRWNGTGLEWGPGEQGGGYIVPFQLAPTQQGWLLCDGSTGVATLQSDGTQDFSVTLPNTAGSYYRQ